MGNCLPTLNFQKSFILTLSKSRKPPFESFLGKKKTKPHIFWARNIRPDPRTLKWAQWGHLPTYLAACQRLYSRLKHSSLLHSWQQSYKCLYLCWFDLVALGIHYNFNERTSKFFWTSLLRLAYKWPLMMLYITIS